MRGPTCGFSPRRPDGLCCAGWLKSRPICCPCSARPPVRPAFSINWRFFDELISEALSPELRTAASQLDGSNRPALRSAGQFAGQHISDGSEISNWMRPRPWKLSASGFNRPIGCAGARVWGRPASRVSPHRSWRRSWHSRAWRRKRRLRCCSTARRNGCGTCPTTCTCLRGRAKRTTCSARCARELEFAEPLVLPARPLPRFAKSLELMRIEQALAFPLGRLSAPTDRDLAGAVRVLECESSRDELRAAARQIRREVTDSGGRVRFRDFAVIVRELEPLAELAADVFDEYDVPCFLDRRSITCPAIVRCVDALARRDRLGFRRRRHDRAAAVRAGRSAGGGQTRQPHCDARDQRSRRLGKAQWSFSAPADRRPHDGSTMRAGLAKQLLPLAERALPLIPPSSSGCRPCMQLYRSLAFPAASPVGSIPPSSGMTSKRPRRIGRRGRRFAQRSTTCTNGSAKREFPATSCAGCSAAPTLLKSDVGFAPPMLDQVLIGSIERSRHPAVRHAWIVGFNDGVFPRPPAAEPVLSAAERAALAEAGVAELAAKSGNPLDERLLAYIAVTRTLVTISYARTGSDGGALRPSPLLADVFGALPGLGAQVESESAPETLRELGALLARGGPHAYRSRCLAAERTLARDRTTAETLRRLLRGRNYENSADRAVMCPFRTRAKRSRWSKPNFAVRSNASRSMV